MLALLSVICIYGALASLMNSIFSQQLLPMGPRLLKVSQKQFTFHSLVVRLWSILFFPVPLLQEEVKKKSGAELPCPAVDSHLTSSLQMIATCLEEGSVCGIPTDTVYALAASCKNPQAIEKIYNIKVRNKNRSLI